MVRFRWIGEVCFGDSYELSIQDLPPDNPQLRPEM